MLLSRLTTSTASRVSRNVLSKRPQVANKGYHSFGLQRYESPQSQMNFIWGLIGVNLTVFSAWQYADATRNNKLHRFLMHNFTLSQYGLRIKHYYHTLITSTFSHMSFGHFAFNMFALYTFGINTISVLGRAQFAMIYFGGAFFSSAFQMIWPKLIPRSWPAYHNYNANSISLGASGAVNSILAWSILAFPHSRIYFFGVLPVPASIAGLSILAFDAYGLYTGRSQTGNAAHISGAAVGAAFFLARRALRR